MRYVFFCFFSLAPITALAHIQLESPTARYSNIPVQVNKSCPCGAGNNNRTCTEAPFDDPNRDDGRATTLSAGSELTLHWRETVGHSGRYRVAFSPDGADLASFDANVLADIVDPPGNEGNTGDGDNWELTVTLPDSPCSNCTLQLVQVMDGDTQSPAVDTRNRSSYYQCADIVLVEGDVPPPTCACVGSPKKRIALGLGALTALFGLLIRRQKRV